MSRTRTRTVMLAVAVAAVLASVIIAVSTDGGASTVRVHGNGTSPAATSELALAARYLGVTPTQLRQEIRSGRTLAQIADATGGRSAAGLLSALLSARAGRLRTTAATKRLSPTQEQARLADLRRRIDAQINRPRADGVPGYVGLLASARYLGVSASQLRAELRTGRSLAQIAGTTPGKSATGLIDTRVSAREAELDAAVAHGRITRAQARALLSNLRARVTHEVERTPSR